MSNVVAMEWKEYLKKMKLSEVEMHPVQLQETKRAFYGGWGQSLAYQIDTLVAVAKEDPVGATTQIFALSKEINQFWSEQK